MNGRRGFGSTAVRDGTVWPRHGLRRTRVVDQPQRRRACREDTATRPAGGADCRRLLVRRPCRRPREPSRRFTRPGGHHIERHHRTTAEPRRRPRARLDGRSQLLRGVPMVPGCTRSVSSWPTRSWLSVSSRSGPTCAQVNWPHLRLERCGRSLAIASKVPSGVRCHTPCPAQRPRRASQASRAFRGARCGPAG